MSNRRINLVGQIFGKLTVQSFSEVNAGGNAVRLCICTCGGTKQASTGHLRCGSISSCGCEKANNAKKHGMFGTPEYSAYNNAHERCTNPKNERYPRYGVRGIQFRYTSFEQFLADVGPRPSPAHSLD